MKTLLIIRHAKSEQSFLAKDVDRPLNERGLRDAPMMAKRIKEKGIQPDKFVSSPANRAKTTAAYFAAEFNTDKRDILLRPNLYHAPPEIFFSEIEKLNDEWDSVAMFAHNPGITYFVNELIGDVHIDNMPTCGVFAIQVKTDRWEKFREARKEFLFFDWPKNF